MLTCNSIYGMVFNSIKGAPNFERLLLEFEVIAVNNFFSVIHETQYEKLSSFKNV